MDMTGEYVIAAPRAVVWAALNDPDVLRQCIPGCETLEARSPTELAARVRLKVGPISTTFNGTVTLENVQAPESYTIVGQGQGGAAGFAKGRAAVRLVAEAAETTRLQYTAKADVGGKLATLGGRLIDATSKKLADEFFDKFVATVAPPLPAEGGEPSAAAARKGFWSKWLGRG